MSPTPRGLYGPDAGRPAAVGPPEGSGTLPAPPLDLNAGARSRAVLGAALIVAVTVPLFILGLGARNIWIPLEARYALVAREMLAGAHWVLPHLDGRVYADKPPLLFWSIALLGSLGPGVTEWTARLPSAVAAILACLLTWRVGAALFSPRAGLLAALVLATSAGFFWSAREALPDMLLTLWITWACWGLWRWLAAKRSGGAVTAGISMGLGALTKGPVGFLLPAFTALAYLTVRRDWRAARGPAGLLCAGSFLVTALAWYLPAVSEGGLQYVRNTLLHHSVERYFSAWEHKAPFYFYLGAFPAEFLPWTLFLPQALMRAGGRPRPDRLPAWWFCVCWLATILLFFSVSTGKRDVYILPAYPAAALLVGWIWSEWWGGFVDRASARAMLIPVVVLTAAVLGLGVAVAAGRHAALPLKASLLLPADPGARAGTVAFLALAGVVLATTALLRKPRWVFGCVVVGASVAMLVGTLVHTAGLNRRNPIRAFSRAVADSVGPGEPLAACGPLNDLAVSFNVGRPLPLLPTEPEVVRHLSSPDPAYCVMDRRTYARIGEMTGRRFPVLVQRQFERSALLLVSSAPR